MRFLILEWAGYMQEDLEECLHSMGIETVEYGYCVTGFENDAYFYDTFREILQKEQIDAVMMMNYMVPMAVLCHEFGIPFISWVYDSPFGISKPEETLSFPTNFVFFFDRALAERYAAMGFDTVYHMPLAVNRIRLEKLIGANENREKYQCDVSFVGQMYENQYAPFRNRMNDYQGGYFDSLIGIQSKLYGAYLLRDSLPAIVDEKLQELYRDYPELGGMDLSRFRKWVEHTTAKEITRRERLMILRVLSKRHKVALYAPESESLLQDIEYRGIVSAYDEAPLVYYNSKINLNMTLKDIETGIPLRALEILGSGGFLLTNWQQEIAECFTDGEELVMYESVEDAIMKAEYYLKHEDERIRIARNGYEAAGRFSFESRLAAIVDTVFSR